MSYIGRQLNLPASTVQLTAEGAITAGKPCIVEADGDVAQVAETAVSQAAGTPVVFESAGVTHTSIAYDANAQKVVIAYKDGGNSNYGTAIVGTVSGNSISFGTPTVFESSETIYTSVAYDANAQKVVIAYRDGNNSEYGTGIVGTVSGTSISFGSSTAFETGGSTNYISAVYDSSAQKVVIAYLVSSTGKAVVGTISGTSISFGSVATFNSGNTTYVATSYDENASKVVIAYRDNGNSNYGTAVVGTVSATSISFGSEVVFNSASTLHVAISYDSDAQKHVVAYQDQGNSNYGTAIIGTVSGTSISFGSEVAFNSGASNNIGIVYDSNAQKPVIAYRDNANNSYGTFVSGVVSGTSISFSTATVFESATSGYMDAAFDANAQKVVVPYQDSGNSNYGTAVVLQAGYTSTNLTSENFIGFAGNDCTDNGLATIQLGGSVNDKQSSLTAGQTYFVQTDGTIGTTADSPSVTAGTAVSSTEILVKG